MPYAELDHYMKCMGMYYWSISIGNRSRAEFWFDSALSKDV